MAGAGDEVNLFQQKAVGHFVREVYEPCHALSTKRLVGSLVAQPASSGGVSWSQRSSLSTGGKTASPWSR
jgi:hypothetical protein